MKTTPFTETHIALGAKMHEFAGYNMPIEYSGIIDEHLTVCNAVGVFDVSHMGEVVYEGPDALKIGVGMMTRGEVALIVAQKGLSVGMIGAEYFTAVILLYSCL